MENTELHRFKSIEDILSDKYFISFVEKNISELDKIRTNRPAPKKGYHYKRDWYDRMTNEGIFNSEFFIKNIGDIWAKKSSLNSEKRDIIQHVCDRAFQQTLIEYSKEVK